MRSDDPIAEIGSALAEGVLCPIIGSGLGIELGIPSWPKLFEKIIAQSASAVPPSAFATYETPLAFELISEGRNWIEKGLRTELYPPQVPEDWAVSGTPKASIDNSAPVIMAKLCIHIAESLKRSGLPKRTFHALSYNYDILLEEALVSLGHEAKAVSYGPARSQPAENNGRYVAPSYTLTSAAATASQSAAFTFRPNELRKDRFYLRDRIPSWRRHQIVIAHPHGVLLRWKASKACSDAGAEGLVLDAASYDTASWSPFSPAGYWQLAAYAGLRCLFVGFSFKDAAVRRLLRFADELKATKGGVRQRHLALIVEPNGELAGRLTEMLARLGIAAWVFTQPWPLYRILRKVIEARESLKPELPEPASPTSSAAGS